VSLTKVPAPARFIAVGFFCSALQLVILFALVNLGVSRLIAHLLSYTSSDLSIDKEIANLLGFAISTQVNFTLSYHFTWFERKAPVSSFASVAKKLFSFNLMALTSLMVNQMAFAFSVHLHAHYLLAGVIGILTAFVVNFGVSKWIIFRPETVAVPTPID